MDSLRMTMRQVASHGRPRISHDRLGGSVMHIEFRVLGPMEVHRDGQPITISAAQQRAVLAALLLQANRVVSVTRLIDDLWGDMPPVTARATLQSLVRRLRRVLEPHRT